jgi:hypothetical protein
MPRLLEYDRAQFMRIVAAQFGVISRDQALSCGITRGAIAYRLRRDGPWRQILPAVYMISTGTPTAEQREMAALLYAGPDSRITGPVALGRQGMQCDDPGVIDVLVPQWRQRKSTAFVRIQRATRIPQQTFRIGALRYVPAPRALADTVRAMSTFSDVETLVSRAVQKRKCTTAELASEVETGRMQGSRLLREAFTEVKSGIWSSAEGDLKRLLSRAGIEEPVFNPMLYTQDGMFLGCPDAWWPKAGVAAEVDSVQYHLEARGYAETMRRHNRMAKAGINVLHWLPRTIRNQPDEVISDLQEALREGNKRPALPIITMRTGG